MGSGARRDPASQGPVVPRDGNLIRVAPRRARREERGRRPRASRPQSSSSRSRPSSSRSATRRRPSSCRARRSCCRRAGKFAVDERTNMLIITDVARQPRARRARARNLDTQTPQVLDRGAHRRGAHDVHARLRHPVGRQRASRGRRRQPDRPRVPVDGRRGRRRTTRHATPVAAAVAARRRTSSSTCRPPSAPARRRARPHARLGRRQRQHQPAPLGAREHRQRAHHLGAEDHDARQHRGDDQPGHVDPDLGRVGGRTQHGVRRRQARR